MQIETSLVLSTQQFSSKCKSLTLLPQRWPCKYMRFLSFLQGSLQGDIYWSNPVGISKYRYLCVKNPTPHSLACLDPLDISSPYIHLVTCPVSYNLLSPTRLSAIWNVSPMFFFRVLSLKIDWEYECKMSTITLMCSLHTQFSIFHKTLHLLHFVRRFSIL